MDPWLARVLAEPHDAALRTVWADELQQRGDPRGEVIALQLLPPPLTPAQDQRLRSLLAKHRVEWLGELAPIMQHREGLEFDRGVLVNCQIQVKSVPALAKAVGNPLWATLQRIWFCDKFAWDPRIVPLLVDPVMRELRELWCVGMNFVVPALMRHPRPLPFTSIWMEDDSYRQPTDSFRQLVDAPGLPALRKLGFTVRNAGQEGWVCEHPLVRTIETLGITASETSRPWLEATRSLTNLQALEMRNWWYPVQGPQRGHAVLHFRRGTGGRWSRLEVSLTREYASTLLERELADLAPDALEEITAPRAWLHLFEKFTRAKIIPYGPEPIPPAAPIARPAKRAKPAARRTAKPATKRATRKPTASVRDAASKRSAGSATKPSKANVRGPASSRAAGKRKRSR
jgi:uncharacterized protein (TIGR02996 family)